MRRRNLAFLIGGLLVAAFLAVAVSGFASSAPDGLERVAEDQGFLARATEHAFADSPVADYAIRGIENARLSGGLAGLLGVAMTFALGLGLFKLLKVTRRHSGGEGPR